MDKISILFSTICLIFATNGFVGASTPKPPSNCTHYHAMDFLMCLSYCTEYKDPCEAYPDAICKTRMGKCSTCEVYFEHDNKEVECNPRKKVQECPPDRPPVECDDPCKATVCRPYKTAQCRFDNCGGCNTEYFVGKGWMPCPETISPLGSVHATHKTVCPNGKTPLTCTTYTCDQSRCPNHPSAKCIPDSCDNCKAEYFIFGRNHDAIKVDCSSSACPVDAIEVSCPKDLCNFMPCPNYPQARCVVDNCTQCHVDFVLPNGQVIDKDQCFDRPSCPTQRDPTCHKDVCRASFCPGEMATWCRMNDCGGCKAEWYNSTTGEVISCPYYDRLLEKNHESHVPKEIGIHKQSNGHREIGTHATNVVSTSTTEALGHVVNELQPTTNSKPKEKATLEKTLTLLYQLIDILKKEVAQQKARSQATHTQLAQKQVAKTVKDQSVPNTTKPNIIKTKQKHQAPTKPLPTTKGHLKHKEQDKKQKEEKNVIGGVPVDFQKFDFFGENSA